MAGSSPAMISIIVRAIAYDDCNRGPRPAASQGGAMDKARLQPQLARTLVHAACGGFPCLVPRLPARPWGLDVLYGCAAWPHRPIYRPRELRMALGRFHVLAVGQQHPALYRRGQHREICGRALPGDPSQRTDAVQGDHPRAGSYPLHRADGTVRDCILVAFRCAVLDHFLVVEASRADHNEYRFPWRSLERAVVRHFC